MASQQIPIGPSSAIATLPTAITAANTAGWVATPDWVKMRLESRGVNNAVECVWYTVVVSCLV